MVIVVLEETQDVGERDAGNKRRAHPVVDEPARGAQLAPGRAARGDGLDVNVAALERLAHSGAARRIEPLDVKKGAWASHLPVDSRLSGADIAREGFECLGLQLGAEGLRRRPGQNLRCHQKADCVKRREKSLHLFADHHRFERRTFYRDRRSPAAVSSRRFTRCQYTVNNFPEALSQI